jgi:hypothetical protein
MLKYRTVTAPFIAAAVSLLALGPVVPTSAAAQESKSTGVAKELTQALDAAKMDSIAAPDPTDPTAFVAALYFPGAQLLVVTAKYAAPSLLVTKIGTKEYRDIYIDLQSASVAGTKVFVQDQLANGLVMKPSDDGAADIWEVGAKATSFDGEWKKAKMSEADYVKTFAEADQRYAEMLTLLLAKAKGPSGS